MTERKIKRKGGTDDGIETENKAVKIKRDK
jgi:hypothetical protein